MKGGTFKTKCATKTEEEQMGLADCCPMLQRIFLTHAIACGCYVAVLHHFEHDYRLFFLIDLDSRSYIGGLCYLITDIISSDVNHY